MLPVGLTVVTYTYNDHALIRGLIENVEKVLPPLAGLVVVDDGSAEPFAPPEGKTPISVVRLEKNLGPTLAKSAGLDRVASRYFISMDADIRLGPGWAEACLPLAARPGAGMVATPLRSSFGSGPASRYLELHYSHNLNARGEVQVVPGGVWLSSRKVWRESGGFTGHDSRLGSDSFYSSRLRAMGLTLTITPEAEAVQVRTMGRTTMVKRGWTWQGFHIKEALASGRPLEETMAVTALSARRRIQASRGADPDLLYFDLLYLAHAWADLAATAGEATTLARLGRELARLCGGRPLVVETLGRDLARLGDELSIESGGREEEKPFFVELSDLFSQDEMDRMEQCALPAIIREERDAPPDFSLYDEME